MCPNILDGQPCIPPATIQETLMESLLQDVRYGVSMLTKRPAFTSVAVLSLALGIGANTSMFTMINAVFLNPIPVADPSELVLVFTTDTTQDTMLGGLMPMSYMNYRDYSEQNTVLDGLVAFTGAGGSLMVDGEAQSIPIQLVTGNYFDVLGVEAAHGRTFRRDEDQTRGTHPVMVLSHGIWERQFGADPSVIGRVVTLNGMGYTVVGVGPPEFKGTFRFGDPDLVWVPLSMYAQILPPFLRTSIELVPDIPESASARRALIMSVFGRLKEGVTLEQAQANLTTIARQLEQEYPNENTSRGVAITEFSPLGPDPEGQTTLAGGMLMAIVGVVLLIACVNVANLLLARAATREREISIRVALGAGRHRLVRQLLTESVLLALAGGALGLLLAYWGRDLLWNFTNPFLGDSWIDLAINPRVLAFTFGISLLTGVIFGLVPALQSSKPNLSETLHEGGRGGGGGVRQQRLRSALVVAEIALALVALIGAGLFLRSMRLAQQIDTGFEMKQLALMNINPINAGYEPERAMQLYDELLERLAAIGGVESIALSANRPLGGGFLRTVFPEGRPEDAENSRILTITNIISPGYFETLRIPLLRGRDFTASDTEDTSKVAIINEAMKERFWPDEDPLGRRFRFFGEDFQIEVIGIVADAQINVMPPAPAIAHMPLKQRFQGRVVIQARTTEEPETALGNIQDTVRSIDRNLPITGVTTISENLDQALSGPRMLTSLLAIFGTVALALAMVGIYGVMSDAMNQRTHEIGIRMALGAGSSDVLGLVMRQAAVLIGIGVAVGLVAAFAVTRLLQGLLFGISATDPLTYAGVSAILMAVALIANFVPARRVLRVDPVRALRNE